MTPYYEDEAVTIYHGDCREVLPTLAPVETCITDPPYHLTANKRGGSGDASVDLASPYGRARITTGFMGQEWDGGDVAFRVETWAAVMGALLPGAHVLAFGGTRTFHRLMVAIEDAGFEIRDCLSWLYGSGFPKSHNFGEDAEWNGWGTALKPAWEPIVLAMKPLDGTFAGNAEKHGVAGLNVDGARIGTGKPLRVNGDGSEGMFGMGSRRAMGTTDEGRWPANLALDEEAARMLDEQSGELTSGKPAGVKAGGRGNAFGEYAGGIPVTGFGDSGGASRFFYTSKASRADRGPNNDHPTVKPSDLMKWLCKLTATPTGGTVLDPFMGSGTTLYAAKETGRKAIGIELEERYCEIAAERCRQGVLDLWGAA